MYPVRIGPDERPMLPGAPTHLAQAPAWVNLSDSPVCLFAAYVVQFDDPKQWYFDATVPYYLVSDETSHLRMTHNKRSKSRAHRPGRRAPHPKHSRSHAPAPACGS